MSNRQKPKNPVAFPLFRKYQNHICNEIRNLIELWAAQHFLENDNKVCEDMQECITCKTLLNFLAIEEQLRKVKF